MVLTTTVQNKLFGYFEDYGQRGLLHHVHIRMSMQSHFLVKKEVMRKTPSTVDDCLINIGTAFGYIDLLRKGIFEYTDAWGFKCIQDAVTSERIDTCQSLSENVPAEQQVRWLLQFKDEGVKATNSFVAYFDWNKVTGKIR